VTVNGWRLYLHPLIEEQHKSLTEDVKALSKADPKGYKDHPKTKLLATINRYLTEIIPKDPNAPEFRQGNTLGPNNRHWFRAKFHTRYRLFYRFSSKDKVIIYVWVNDESTLRKAGSKTDPYAVFKGMLEAGDPPSDVKALLSRARELAEK
jgi:toxin YhaV